MNSPDAKDAPDKPAPKPAQAGTAPEAPLDEQLAAAKKEAADNHDRYLRAAADLENFRRRTVREKEELRLFAASRLLEDLLPGLDNLALGLEAAKQPNADMKGLAGGVELEEINPLGQAFDPHQHEAIAHQPSADVDPEHVIKVVRTGYVLNGRLLRPAAVVVSGGKPVKEPAA